MVVLSSLCPSVYHYQIVFSPYFNIEILTLSPYFELNMTFHFLFISIDCTLSETSSILFIFILFIYLFFKKHFFIIFNEFMFFSIIFISWRLITLQYCSGFCHILTWNSHGFTCIPHPEPPSPSHPSGSSQCTSPKHLSHASNLDWWSVSQ